MLRKIRRFEQNFSISKAAAIVGFFTLAAKLVALVRDSLLASRFGPGDTLDIYYAAFRIPDFTFNLLVLGTLSVAFIPIFTEWLKKDQAKAYRIANSILNISVVAMLAICAALFFESRPLTHLLVPGFSGEKFDKTVQLTRLFLLSPVIFTVSNVFSSILNSHKRFFILSLAPIAYNFGIIFGLLFLYPSYGLFGLGIGVLAGAITHMIIQIPETMALGWHWQPAFDYKDPILRKVARLFLPRIIGMDNSQISLLIGTTVGSFLASGSVTIFNFANNLQAVPLGIFAFSLATAAFPVLSEQHAGEKRSEFSATLSKTIADILFFIIPLSILMLIFRAFIVRLILGHGKFDWNSTILTFTALGIFAFSLFAQSLIPLLSKAFYARQNTITPVLMNLGSIALNAVLSFLLGKTYGVVGIAAGFAVSITVNCLLLFFVIRHQLGREGTDLRAFDDELMLSLRKIIIASFIMGTLSYAGIYLFAPLVNTRTTIGILIQSSLAAGIGALGYLFMCGALGMGQARGILKPLYKLLGTKNIAA